MLAEFSHIHVLAEFVIGMMQADLARYYINCCEAAMKKCAAKTNLSRE